jgi:adenylylsulfate kinase-like enzyme
MTEQGLTIWFTGLSGAGKSTLSEAVAARLRDQDRAVEILDGDEVRARIGRFVEVFVHCPLDELVRRDVKGLYRRALNGEIEHFTGVSDPYEEPLEPEVRVETGSQSVDEAVTAVLRAVERALGPHVLATPLLAAEEAAG